MGFYKKYDNGLRLIVNKLEGFQSVSAGVLVKTGSINEMTEENGISHFIEHVMFKGTSKRSSFEISDYIDRIGAQINAFTSKELTCYYTKSTKDRLNDSLEVLADIFFDSTFKKEELEKEKGVIIEEINMSEDTPEDLLFDLLAKSYYGSAGLGQTILGPSKNIRHFNQNNIKSYMDKYYTADNVVISIAGNVDEEQTEKTIEELFAKRFSNKKSAEQVKSKSGKPAHLHLSKRIEQSHIGFALKGLKMGDEKSDALSIANAVLGGGMSSRLFQKIREVLGLAYSVYSYPSAYKNDGVIEIYAGVNTDYRDLATNAIAEEVRKFKKDGVTEQEFLRAKEQLKSSTIFGRESTSSQMLVHGKYMIYLGKQFDYDDRIDKLDAITLNDVNEIIEKHFDIDKASTATVGPKRTSLKI
ncbi:MAG: insulinase family protein [Clostridia bacterium]|nr:insulinase family protein [Clostridia bacterium]